MARRSLPISLLLSTGAGLAGALPHPQWAWFHHHHPPNGFPTFSFPGFPYPTQTPAGFSVPSAPGSIVATPTDFSIPGGGAGPTGTGFPSPGTGTGFGYSVSSVNGRGLSSISVPIGTGSSVVVSSSQPPGSSLESASLQQSSALYSLAAAASSSSDSAGSPPASPNSSGLVSSAPAPSAISDPGNASSRPVVSEFVTAASGCTFTDAAAAAASKEACSTIVLSSITVPAGETLDMTDLNDGTTVSFEGTTTFEFEEWDGPLISFSGKSITITGTSGHVIDGNGAKWWDGEGSNGGKTKPKFFYAHDLTDSTISGLNIKNTPVQGISVDGVENLKIADVTIDDSDGDTKGGHNTDCFDIGESTGVYLSGITCNNQDDCIAINSGTDIQFTGGTCSGGHGLSIGSVGGRDDNTVENVYIASSSISNSENGVRIKCNSGDTGSVKNVTYSGITLSGITDFGIVIEQDYENGSPTGTPTDGIPITDVTLEDITGSVTDDAQAYYILCAACSDWTVSGVDLTGGSEDKSCEGVPSGASGLC